MPIGLVHPGLVTPIMFKKDKSHAFCSSQWVSVFRTMGVRFNQNVWKLIPDSYDDIDGCLFGLIDPNDGASFGLDFTPRGDNDTYEYEDTGAEYFMRLLDSDAGARVLHRFTLMLGCVAFKCTAYSYRNARFGNQVVVRGIWIGAHETIGVSMSWPALLPFDGTHFPPKLSILMRHCEVAVSQ